MIRAASSRALGTKVAQRVVLLFAVCAVLPVVFLGLSTYRNVEEGLLEQARQRAQSASKRVAGTISRELDALDSALTATDPSGGARVNPRLGAVALVVRGRQRALRGSLPGLPALSPAQDARLEQGGSILVVVSDRDREPVILLAHLSAVDRPERAVLWAAVPASELARAVTEAYLSPSGGRLCLLGPAGVLLSCPDAGSGLAAGALAPALGSTPAGSFEWSLGDERFLAGYWSLFLGFRFAAPDWRIVHSESLDEVLAPLTSFRRTFPLAALLALSVVAFLSFVQIRRSFGPLRTLQQATQRVAQRDFGQPIDIRSGDEFEELGQAFNGMAVNLQRQFADAEQLNEALRLTSDELQERGARLSAVLESAPDGIVIADSEGRIESFNGQAERLFGYPGGEADGKHVSDLFAVPLAEAQRGVTVPEQLRGLTLQAVGRRRDGSTFPAEVGQSQARAGDRVLDTMFVRDISERKLAQEQRERLEGQLRQAQKMETVGTMAGGIAHDFNNLLAPILGYVELLLADAPPESPRRDDLEQVHQAALRAKGLVRQILSFSRKAVQQFAPVALAPLVGEALTLLRASLPANIEIRSHIEPDTAVLGDATQLHQVVMNLCTNAIHAMRESGGVLEVRLESVVPDASLTAAHPRLATGRAVRITVRDTGHGMDSATMERLFEPFFTTKPPGQGTGLGMAIVHTIVTAHGGVITAESALGVGTRLEIHLPASAIEQALTAAAPAATQRGEGRVLVVDNEDMITRITARVLTRLGYEVLTAGSAVDALDVLARSERAFDLVITDQTMPGMTGLELAERIRSTYPTLPVILMSGYADLGKNNESGRQGIAELLVKPVEIEMLAAGVARVLQAARRASARIGAGDGSGAPG